MSSTTTKGRHAAEWTVFRVVRDRARKLYVEGPSDWGKRRTLTHPEEVRSLLHHTHRVLDAASR